MSKYTWRERETAQGLFFFAHIKRFNVLSSAGDKAGKKSDIVAAVPHTHCCSTNPFQPKHNKKKKRSSDVQQRLESHNLEW